MPYRDIGLVAALLEVVRDHGLAAGGAFVLSWLRIKYDAKETSMIRTLIESSLGAVLVAVVGMTVQSFGLSSGWSFAAAGFVGTLGVNQVRVLAFKWAHRRVEQ